MHGVDADDWMMLFSTSTWPAEFGNASPEDFHNVGPRAAWTTKAAPKGSSILVLMGSGGPAEGKRTPGDVRPLHQDHPFRPEDITGEPTAGELATSTRPVWIYSAPIAA